MSLVQPYLEDIADVTTVYVGIIVFGIMMTVVVVLLLRLNWEKILGRFVPWTLDENNEK
jgi:hypothetical protein